jgi:hypothetical protein
MKALPVENASIFGAINALFQIDPMGWDLQAEAGFGRLVKARSKARMKALP